MTVKERLIKFIEYKELSQSRFEKLVGLANGYVNNIRKSISPEKLQLIALRFPELDTAWLLTNAGQMLKGGKESQTTPTNSSEGLLPISIFEMLLAERSRHDEHITELLRQNAVILKLLEEEKKKVNVQGAGNVKCVVAK